MAEKKPESKSAAIPGGTKASDLPASVGGTKDATPAPGPHNPPRPDTDSFAPDRPVPVTTDAAAVTPPNPHTNAGAEAMGGLKADMGPDFPPVTIGRLDRKAGFLKIGAGEADNVTVADFVGQIKAFTAAVKARDWGGAFRAGSRVFGVFTELMDGGGLFGVTQEDAEVLAGADRVGLELAACRNDLSGALSSGRFVQWAGGEPHPVSGSPMPQGRVSGADATAIDPAMLLVLYELVQKAWAFFQARRNR